MSCPYEDGEFSCAWSEKSKGSVLDAVRSKSDFVNILYPFELQRLRLCPIVFGSVRQISNPSLELLDDSGILSINLFLEPSTTGG